MNIGSQHQLCHSTATAVAVVSASETPSASAAGAATAAASTSTLINENDVLCGRGKGKLHSHVGNKNCRLLIHVNMNSNLYTKRHTKDKKITRGIRAAVRSAGGRFISYERRGDTVSADDDIGDKKAFFKTSKAIRDKISKNEYDDENEDDALFFFDTSTNVESIQELPQKWYTEYSSQLLKSINSSNAVTAGVAPQNERAALVQNHQEVSARTSTTSGDTCDKSNPFYQEHVSQDRYAHQYLPLPERLSSGSSHFSFGSFLDGCFEEAPQNEKVALVQNHQEVPAYTSRTAKSSPFHQEHVTRARDAHQYQPLPVRQSSRSSHCSFGSFLD